LTLLGFKLFDRFDHNPLEDRRFLDLLLHYRHTVALACSS